MGLETGRGEQGGLPGPGPPPSRRRLGHVRFRARPKVVAERRRRPRRQPADDTLRRATASQHARPRTRRPRSAPPRPRRASGEMAPRSTTTDDVPTGGRGHPPTGVRAGRDQQHLLQHAAPPPAPGPGRPAPAADLPPRRVHSTPARPCPPGGRSTPPAGTSSDTGTDSTGRRTWPTTAASRGTAVSRLSRRPAPSLPALRASRLSRATSTSSTVSPDSAVAPRRSRSAWASSWMARAIRAEPSRRDWARAFLAGKALRSPSSGPPPRARSPRIRPAAASGR